MIGIIQLKSLYKQTLKTLDKKSNQYHHCRVLEKYNFLSFDNFRLVWNLCMVYKMLNGLAPSILRDFVHFRSTVSARFTRSSSTSDCVIPFRHSDVSFGLWSFSVKAITCWNSLSEDIRMCISIDIFKLKLKSYLRSTQLCKHWHGHVVALI